MQHYDLVEVFASLQGEGRNMGRKCVFIRFAGCNLKCEWCDTEVERRYTQGLEELLAEVGEYKIKNIVLTGGEPTIQAGMPELVARLKADGYWIAVETNGTNGVDKAEWLNFVDYIACSPKVGARIELQEANEVRVVADREDIAEFCKKTRRQIKADDYYVSPCDRGGKIDFALAKAAIEELEGWSLSVQLHKLLGFK